MCNVRPEHKDILLQENNQVNVALYLSGPTLHKKITCAMLAETPQSSQYFLATSKTIFYARTNYLCNVDPERTAIFSKQNNLYNVVLICLGQHCTRKLSLQY